MLTASYLEKSGRAAVKVMIAVRTIAKQTRSVATSSAAGELGRAGERPLPININLIFRNVNGTNGFCTMTYVARSIFQAQHPPWTYR